MSLARRLVCAGCLLILIGASPEIFGQDQKEPTNSAPQEADVATLAAVTCGDVHVATLNGLYFYSKVICETQGEGCKRTPTGGMYIFSQPVTTGCMKPAGAACKCADNLTPIGDIELMLAEGAPVTVSPSVRLVTQSYPAEEGQPNISVGSSTSFVKSNKGEVYYRLLTLSLTVNGERTEFRPMAIQLTEKPLGTIGTSEMVSTTELKSSGMAFRILTK